MITIKVTKETLDQINKDFSDYIVDKDKGYVLFSARFKDNIITAYSNKKGQTFKVTIQGENGLEIAKKYANDEEINENKPKVSKESAEYVDINNQIGSDEVGTGDFLGPIVVCAAYCDLETMKIVDSFGIKDSKKFTDAKILEIVPELLGKVNYQVKLLPNSEFNDAVSKGFNMNKIKCILHNYVLVRLRKRAEHPISNVYVDQFCPENTYYEYLKGQKVILNGIKFKEKGETYYPSVALGSCIARYFFLKHMEELSKKYKMDFPLGAGSKVDYFAKKFVLQYGLEELKKVCKMNFANYKNLINESTKLF